MRGGVLRHACSAAVKECFKPRRNLASGASHRRLKASIWLRRLRAASANGARYSRWRLEAASARGRAGEDSQMPARKGSFYPIAFSFSFTTSTCFIAPIFSYKANDSPRSSRAA